MSNKIIDFDLHLAGKIHISSPPLWPGRLKLTLSGETKMGLQFQIELPALAAGADVAQRSLSVAIDGGLPQVTEVTDLAQTSVGGFTGTRNALVDASLVDRDAAGNQSPPAVLHAQLIDTIPPSQPGALGLTVTGETP